MGTLGLVLEQKNRCHPGKARQRLVRDPLMRVLREKLGAAAICPAEFARMGPGLRVPRNRDDTKGLDERAHHFRTYRWGTKGALTTSAACALPRTMTLSFVPTAAWA